MYLVADLGNTHIKIGLYVQDELAKQFRWGHNEALMKLNQLFDDHRELQAAIISSVLATNHELTRIIKHRIRCLELNSNTPIPLSNAYKSPKTLGNDRLCNAVALYTEFPNSNALSIDLGTCVKYDFVSDSGEYLGGAIAPGLKMRYKSMHDQTAKLPEVNKLENTPLLGTNTEESLTSGVMNGIQFEIKGTIAAYQQIFENIKVVFTGGDHIHFVEGIKNDIFARPNLTLDGLYQILKFNEVN